MDINLKSIKGFVFIGSVAIAAVGFIISTTKGAVEVTQTLERVNATQQDIMKTNSDQHGAFDKRITATEAWILRKEGYDAARAEMELRNKDGD